jgi:hypothetical protein
MNHEHYEDNDAERARLRRIAADLGENDLERTLGNGMTVAAALVHLAYWDEYCVALLRGWQRDGVSPTRGGDLDATNAAVAAIAAALPGPAAVRLAEEAAEKADALVASLDQGFVEAIEKAHASRMVHRALHRRAHLDQIERAVRAGESL